MDRIMEIIVNNESMEKVAAIYGEIIIYGAGNMGRAVIKNMIERGWRDKIACCVVKNALENPKEVEGVPVLELKQLPHFRDTACFMIAIMEDKQRGIYEDLLQFGCKNIVIVEYSYALELERWHLIRQSGMSSYESLRSEVMHLAERLEQIECQIREQNEICATNTKAFKKFENCNFGKDVVIVASGPTLKYYKPEPEKIYVGVNSTWKRKDIPFNYFFVQDGNRSYAWNDMINGVFENIKGNIFIGKYLKDCPWKEIEFPVYCNTNKTIRRYYVESLNKTIYQNICFHSLIDFNSVIFPALHFTLFTYPKRIYLAGCDVSNIGRFDREVHCSQWMLNMWKIGYAKLKEFKEQYYPETEIISINPVGLKGLFTDLYTDNFLKDR